MTTKKKPAQDSLEAEFEKLEAKGRLTRDQVIALHDVQVEWFEVPEWGGSVPLRALDAWQQSEYQQGLMEITSDAKGNIKTKPMMLGANVRLCALGIRDDDGPWFTVDQLKSKSAGAVNRIAERLRTISGLDSSALEEAEGN